MLTQVDGFERGKLSLFTCWSIFACSSNRTHINLTSTTWGIFFVRLFENSMQGFMDILVTYQNLFSWSENKKHVFGDFWGDFLDGCNDCDELWAVKCQPMLSYYTTESTIKVYMTVCSCRLLSQKENVGLGSTKHQQLQRFLILRLFYRRLQKNSSSLDKILKALLCFKQTRPSCCLIEDKHLYTCSK